MAGILQHRRSNTAGLAATTPAAGEIMLNTDNWKMFIGDGTTANGLLIGRLLTSIKTTDYGVLNSDDETHFNNIGAAGTVIFTLPTAFAGLSFGFLVYAAQILRVVANTGNFIAIGNLNSASAGNVESNLPFSFIKLEAHTTTQWIASSVVGPWTVT